MAFQVLTRKAEDTTLTVGTSRASLALCDADLATALSATSPSNVFIAVRDDSGTTLAARFLVIRDWPPGTYIGIP